MTKISMQPATKKRGRRLESLDTKLFRLGSKGLVTFLGGTNMHCDNGWRMGGIWINITQYKSVIEVEFLTSKMPCLKIVRTLARRNLQATQCTHECLKTGFGVQLLFFCLLVLALICNITELKLLEHINLVHRPRVLFQRFQPKLRKLSINVYYYIAWHMIKLIPDEDSWEPLHPNLPRTKMTENVHCTRADLISKLSVRNLSWLQNYPT